MQTLSDSKGMGRVAHLGSMNTLKSWVLLWEPRQEAHKLFNIHSRLLDTCRRRQHSIQLAKTLISSQPKPEEDVGSPPLQPSTVRLSRGSDQVILSTNPVSSRNQPSTWD